MKSQEKIYKSLVFSFRVELVFTIIWALYTVVTFAVGLTNGKPVSGFNFVALGVWLLLTGTAKYSLNNFVDAAKKAETKEEV